MFNLGEAYRKLIGKTNKRRCEPHGQIEKKRTKDEQKTNNERRNSALKVKVKWS